MPLAVKTPLGPDETETKRYTDPYYAVFVCTDCGEVVGCQAPKCEAAALEFRFDGSMRCEEHDEVIL